MGIGFGFEVEGDLAKCGASGCGVALGGVCATLSSLTGFSDGGASMWRVRHPQLLDWGRWDGRWQVDRGRGGLHGGGGGAPQDLVKLDERVIDR